MVTFQCFIGHAAAPAPGVQWTQNYPQQKDSAIGSLAVDAAGCSYTAGGFADPVLDLGGIQLTNLGSWSVFLIKSSPAGDILWAKQGGTGMPMASASKEVPGGNWDLWVTGSFEGDQAFLGESSVNSAGGSDMFVARLDQDGNYVWIRRGGGTSYDSGRSIAVDAEGNCVVLGDLYTTNATFGTQLITRPDADVSRPFLARYSSEGDLQWVRFITGLTSYNALGLDMDAQGDVWVAGAAGPGDPRLVVARYDRLGNLTWEQTVASGDASSSLRAIATDPEGYAYITGDYTATNFWVGTTQLTNAVHPEIHPTVLFKNGFLAKLGPDGSVLWAEAMDGHREVEPRSLAVDTKGQLYVSGWHNSPALTFGAITLSLNNTNPTAWPSDAFIFTLSPDGVPNWGRTLGNPGSDVATRLKLDPAGNIFLSGHTYTSGTPSYQNAYLAKLETSVPPWLSVERTATELSLAWTSLAVGFHLEASDHLEPGAHWTTNLPSPEVVGLSNVVHLPTSSPARLFRLRRP